MWMLSKHVLINMKGANSFLTRMVYPGTTSFPFALLVQQQQQRKLSPNMNQGSGTRLPADGRSSCCTLVVKKTKKKHFYLRIDILNEALKITNFYWTQCSSKGFCTMLRDDMQCLWSPAVTCHSQGTGLRKCTCVGMEPAAWSVIFTWKNNWWDIMAIIHTGVFRGHFLEIEQS